MKIDIIPTHEMLRLISELDEFKGSWTALGRLAPERLQGLQRVATVESVASSTRIEGVQLSDAEVESLLMQVDNRKFESRDEEEVAGYAAALSLVFDSYEQITITENHLKHLHAVLCKFTTKDERHRGQYKKVPNNIDALDAEGQSLGILLETTSPFDTPREMADLVDWTRDALETHQLHPLVVIAVFVARFLAIHPFQDRNGRLSRVLTTLLLLQSGYHYVRYSSLERVIEENRDSYYLALQRTQRSFKKPQADWQPWVHFFLRSMQEQKRALENKVKRERLLANNLPDISLKILEIVRERGRAQISDLDLLLDVPRPTIKVHLKTLVQSGHLLIHGKGRGTWYSAS